MVTEYKIGDIVLGNWKLVNILGEGSFGRVYEAEREDFGNVYRSAIKTISIPQSQSEIASVRSEGLDDATVTEYFYSIVEDMVSEFSLMAKLKGNSTIVSYEDHAVVPHKGSVGWDILIRMELLTPLISYLECHTMSEEDILRLGIDMCRALELCEKYNIIHRDIKPENIFVSNSGSFKLGDFGIARTIENTVGALSKKGTYSYMAPEVYREETYSAAVDIYSLGIVLYSLLNNNRIPFLPPDVAIKRSDRETALSKRFGGEKLPRPPHGSSRLVDTVLKACSFEAKDRYNSPAEMRIELEDVLNGTAKVSAGADKTVVDTAEKPKNELRTTANSVKGTCKTVIEEKADDRSSSPASEKRTIRITAAAIGVALLGFAAFKLISGSAPTSAPAPSAIVWENVTEAPVLPSEASSSAELTDENLTLKPAGTAAPKVSAVPKETEAPEKTANPQNSAAPAAFSSLSVGDTVSFGLFEQDNNTANGREQIDWVILTVEEGRALLMAVKGLTNQPFDNNKQSCWETSSLHE